MQPAIISMSTQTATSSASPQPTPLLPSADHSSSTEVPPRPPSSKDAGAQSQIAHVSTACCSRNRFALPHWSAPVSASMCPRLPCLPRRNPSHRHSRPARHTRRKPRRVHARCHHRRSRSHRRRRAGHPPRHDSLAPSHRASQLPSPQRSHVPRQRRHLPASRRRARPRNRTRPRPLPLRCRSLLRKRGPLRRRHPHPRRPCSLAGTLAHRRRRSHPPHRLQRRPHHPQLIQANLADAGVTLGFARLPWDAKSDFDRHHLAEAFGPALMFNRLRDVQDEFNKRQLDRSGPTT